MYRAGSAENAWKAVLGFAPPKCGKSTFALYAPQPILVLNYDGGNPAAPPGAGNEIYIQDYPVAETEIDPKNAKWSRTNQVGAQMIQDIIDVRNTLITDAKELTLNDWHTGEKFTMPRPMTVVLDGLVQFNTALMDWLMFSKNYKDTYDAGADVIKFWGMRLDRMNTLFRYILPLPCHKVLNTWQTDEKEGGGVNAKHTGNVIPDIGGKMNDWSAGMVDASLYFFTEKINNQTKYYVCTKPTSNVKCLGVRGRYDLPDSIDITLDTKNPKNPWERVWGVAKETETKRLTK